MPPTRPLRPVIPDNARTLRITAAAGTELAGASSPGTVRWVETHGSPRATGVYEPKPFLPHAASLRQDCSHCARFPTAASRRSLGPAPEVSSTGQVPRRAYAVLPGRWAGYPPREGRSLTCYAPVRRCPGVAPGTPRLACVKHAASVRPEPGSNSPREFNARWLFELLSRCLLDSASESLRMIRSELSPKP
jgi:hypothetical protein